MPSADVLAEKQKYFQRLTNYFNEYPRVLLISADNVGSRHLSLIRRDLRTSEKPSEVLMGKNTLIRKWLRGYMEQKPEMERLLPHIQGNIGFVFTKDDAADVRKEIESNVVGAPAKAGAIAPCDVTVPAGPTGMEPTMTSFMQALSIPTKIARNQIEILKDVQVIWKGDKVGNSEAALLQKLGIQPFAYGLVVRQVYDEGQIFPAQLLDLGANDVLKYFQMGVNNVAAISLEFGLPTLAAVPHHLITAIRNVLRVAIASDIEIEATKEIREYLADPSAFASAAPAASAATDAAPAKEEAKESESESDDDMGFGLFD